MANIAYILEQGHDLECVKTCLQYNGYFGNTNK